MSDPRAMSDADLLRPVTDADLLAAIKGTAASAPARVGYIPGVPSARTVNADARADRALQITEQNAARAASQAATANARADRQEQRQDRIEARQDTASRRPPPVIMGGYLENKTAALKLQKALEGLKAYPGAVGLQNVFGDTISQRADPEGINVRADIADIGSLKIHDRSGAAVTASETPRLKPFIPSANDTPEAARKKLERLLSEIEATQSNISATYELPNEDAPQAETPEKTGFTTENLYQPTEAENEALNAFLKTSPTPDQLINFVRELTGGKQSISPEDAESTVAGAKAGANSVFAPKPSETNGIKDSLLGAVAGAADTFTGGYLPEIAGGLAGAITGDDSLTQKAEENLAAIRNQAPGSFFTGQVAGGIGGSAALGAGAAKLGSKIAPSAAQFLSGGGKVAAGRELGKDVAYGALYGSGSAKEGERGAGALTGALGAAAGNVAGSALVGGVGRVLKPKTDPDVTFLRERGVRTTPLQSLGETASRVEQKLSKTIPLVGDLMGNARDVSLDDFNTAFLNEGLTKIGKPLPRGVSGTAAMKSAQDAFNDAYDDARAGMQLRPDRDYLIDLATLSRKAESALDEDTLKSVQKIYKQNVERITKANPVLDGNAYKEMSSTLGKLAEIAKREQKFGKSEILADMQAVIDKAARRSSPPEAIAKLDAADEGYALFVRAENAARMRGGDTGKFTVAQLDSAVQKADNSIRSKAYLRGDALGQQFVEAGKRIIGSNAEGSPTAGRLGLGAAALTAYVEPTALAAGALTGLPYLPGVRNAASSALAGNRGKTANKAAKLLRENKRVGTAIGAGIATPALIGPQ